jgi:hypothetical protein
MSNSSIFTSEVREDNPFSVILVQFLRFKYVILAKVEIGDKVVNLQEGTINDVILISDDKK